MFSDQSTLSYINEDLKADNGARLLLENRVAYADFEDYQKPSVDHLIKLGILEDTGTRVQLVNSEQFLILNALFTTQAASYYHLSNAGRAEADAMLAKGWATRRSSLFTDAEAKYFNHFLNRVDCQQRPPVAEQISAWVASQCERRGRAFPHLYHRPATDRGAGHQGER